MQPRPPAISATAFDCPHCGAFTSQHWYCLRADELSKGRTPTVASSLNNDPILSDPEMSEDGKNFIREWQNQLGAGFVILEESSGDYYNTSVQNLSLSKCYNCDKVAVWVAESLVFPIWNLSTSANPDLPADIIKDFNEARSIVDSSPRGAAALLRLCIQKLCAFLGEKGKRIDDDIGTLVKKGLNPVVQQSLDIVRVIGNESVHPGVFDLNDDRATALSLFDLVNAVADQMISHPKKVADLYSKLPPDKIKGIENRDKA